MSNTKIKILRSLPLVVTFDPVEEKLELGEQEWLDLLSKFRSIDSESPDCQLENWLITNSYAAAGAVIVDLSNGRRRPALSC